MERSEVPGGWCLWGSSTVLGMATPSLVAEREVEELIVRAPPEGVVDDDRSGKRRVLQVAAIEGNVVGDAIDDDVVGRGLRHPNFADDGQLGLAPPGR